MPQKHLFENWNETPRSVKYIFVSATEPRVRLPGSFLRSNTTHSATRKMGCYVYYITNISILLSVSFLAHSIYLCINFKNILCVEYFANRYIYFHYYHIRIMEYLQKSNDPLFTFFIFCVTRYGQIIFQ